MTHLNDSHDGVIIFMRGSRFRRLGLQLGMIILARMLRLQPPDQTLAIKKQQLAFHHQCMEATLQDASLRLA
jgi:hypothetical protein